MTVLTLGVGLGPGDHHLPACWLSLFPGVTRGWIDAVPAAQHLPIKSRPGLALIANTEASARAQVAKPRLPLAPLRHGLAGDRGTGKKGSAGRGICESQLKARVA